MLWSFYYLLFFIVAIYYYDYNYFTYHCCRRELFGRIFCTLKLRRLNRTVISCKLRRTLAELPWLQLAWDRRPSYRRRQRRTGRSAAPWASSRGSPRPGCSSDLLLWLVLREISLYSLVCVDRVVGVCQALLDEPTSGLDEEAEERLFAAFQAACKAFISVGKAVPWPL